MRRWLDHPLFRRVRLHRSGRRPQPAIGPKNRWPISGRRLSASLRGWFQRRARHNSVARVAVVDSDGNVTGYRDEITPTPRHKLKASASAAVKGVMTKSGSLRIETHYTSRTEAPHRKAGRPRF